MAFSTVPFIFSPNTLIQSAQVNADFASLVEDGNNIDASQITTGTLGVPVSTSSIVATTGNISGLSVTDLNAQGITTNNLVADGDITANTGHIIGLSATNINAQGVTTNTLSVTGNITATSGSIPNLTVTNLAAQGINAAISVSTPVLAGGPSNAGTLQCSGSSNLVNFRWNGTTLFYRINETVEHGIATSSLFAAMTQRIDELTVRVAELEAARGAP